VSHIGDAGSLTHLKSSSLSAKAVIFIFHLLEPRLELLLSHLQVLDVGSGTDERTCSTSGWKCERHPRGDD
jgi:hypothetical protein